MTEITDHDPNPEGDDDWLIADEPARDVVQSRPVAIRGPQGEQRLGAPDPR